MHKDTFLKTIIVRMHCHLVAENRREHLWVFPPDHDTIGLSPCVLLNELVLGMYSLLTTKSFSEGLDVMGILVLFFWLKSGTERHPRGDTVPFRHN